MNPTVRAVLSVLGRVMFALIFVGSAVNKISTPDQTKGAIRSVGMADADPLLTLLYVGAIAFLVVGGASVVLGYRARIGATLLLVFLILATAYFHPPTDPKNMIDFLKNTALMGACVFIIANGSGAGSLDSALARREPPSQVI